MSIGYLEGLIMKFSHSLQFNSVPEWSSKYIAYSHLKKLIYTLQKEKLYHYKTIDSDPEHSQLNFNYTDRFFAELNRELHKIDKFYKIQEAELVSNFTQVEQEVQIFFDEWLNMSHNVEVNNNRISSESHDINSGRLSLNSMGREISYSEEDEEGQTINGNLSTNSHFLNDIVPSISRLTNYIVSDPFIERQVSLKKRLIVTFTQLSELQSFIELNYTGFSKICKKFDKSLETHIKMGYLQSLPETSYIFNDRTMNYLKKMIHQTIFMYAKLTSQDNDPSQHIINFHEAERELSLQLREHVVWERNTVWKDMMNIERKAHNIKAEKNSKQVGLLFNENSVRDISGEDRELTMMNNSLKLTFFQYLNLIFQSTQLTKFFFITLIFIILLKLSPFDDLLQKNCLAILIYVSFLWGTEVLPLFVTSLMIPLLIVLFPVLKDSNDHILTSKESSQYILSVMWSSVIMLLLGGFTLASALSKYNIAKILSARVLSSAGTNPKILLIANMLFSLFVSMWVSNVAAPVLCYSIIRPLLRTLPRDSSFAKSLILGIALSSNIGGMASPIASPQNIISIGAMSPPPSWIEWLFVSLPVCILCIFSLWVILLISFPIDRDLKILHFHTIEDPLTIQQWYIIIISIATILLWCLASQLSGIFGDMGIISIIPMILFFGTGILNSDDFNNFMWTIVILAMGGSCLGKAVTSSGLLNTIAYMIKIQLQDQPIFIIVLIFGISILTIATFVSHTVAAIILVPLMKEIGVNLPSGDHSRLLIMMTALLCSSAMGLPTSGFPNVTAISILDEVGDRYLTTGDLIKRGIPTSLVSYVFIVTIGYGLMKFIGF